MAGRLRFTAPRRVSAQPAFLRFPAVCLVMCAVLVPSLTAQTSATDDSQRVSTVADTSDYIFLRPHVDYGSEALFGPVQVVLNRAFSTTVWAGAERRLGSVEWRGGIHSVWDALSQPGAAIERAGGFGTWIKRETLPGSSVWTWSFAPNIAGHLVAGGISYRHLAEWMKFRGVPAPRLVAAGFSWAAGFVNEVMEAAYDWENVEIVRADPWPPGHASTVGDLYIFDPLGMLLFEIDAVARFFSGPLRAADWSPQASITLPNGRVQNVAQVMSYNVRLPFNEHLRALFLLGQGTQVGVIYQRDDGYALGGATGFSASARHTVPVIASERIDAEISGGLYLSRNNSLLGSLVLANVTPTAVQVNIYPGLVPGPLKKLGVWASIGRGRESSFGLSFGMPWGVGLGYDVAAH